MHFKKITGPCEELTDFYNEALSKKYEILPLPMIEKFISSENIECYVCHTGGIFYTGLDKSSILYIHYICSETTADFLNLIIVAMLDEDCDICVIDSAEWIPVFDEIGFKKLNLKFKRPAISYDKEDKETSLLIYGANCIEKMQAKRMIKDYYQRIALYHNPEEADSYIENLHRINEMEGVFA